LLCFSDRTATRHEPGTGSSPGPNATAPQGELERSVGVVGNWLQEVGAVVAGVVYRRRDSAYLQRRQLDPGQHLIHLVWIREGRLQPRIDPVTGNKSGVRSCSSLARGVDHPMA
jgi:hypothetical protein